MTDIDLERGLFQAQVIHAKIVNKRVCIEEGLIRADGKEFSMTPQEELFSKFFSSEKILIKDMDLVSLRAHREELSQIAFEARARLSAVDDEERTRKNGSGIRGFERSINTDDITSDAINAINARSKRLDKKEKIRQNLLEMGVDPAEVDKIMSNKGIRDLSRPQAVLTGKDENKSVKQQTSGGMAFDWDKIVGEAKAKEAEVKEDSSPEVKSNPFGFLNKN